MAKNYASKDPKRPINETPIYLSADGIEQLRTRYERLKKRLPDLAAETARTAAYGDRSDNAEYKQAKGALRYTQFEIYRLEDELKRAVEIEPGKNAEGTVRMGSVVVVVEMNGASGANSTGAANNEKTFEILGPEETNPGKGRISNQSPLGLALMNRGAGDVVEVKTANGVREYRIIEVR